MRAWMLLVAAVPALGLGILTLARVLQLLEEDAEEGRAMIEAGDDELMKTITRGGPR